MPEIIVGPKGELLWNEDQKTRIFADTGSWVYVERARNAALDWRDAKVIEALKRYVPRISSMLKAMTDRGYVGTTPVHRQKGTMRHNEGRYIGVESNRSWGDEKAPVYHSLRIDADDAKGPHYNVMLASKTETLKACFRFDAPAGRDPKEWVAAIQARRSR